MTGYIRYTDGKRSWIGFNVSEDFYKFYYSVKWDMNTNGGYTNYEEKLHVLNIGPLQWRWYTLT